jgi:hypothetical protein
MSFINHNFLILHIYAYSFSNLLILLIPSGASVYKLPCVQIKYLYEEPLKPVALIVPSLEEQIIPFLTAMSKQAAFRLISISSLACEVFHIFNAALFVFFPKVPGRRAGCPPAFS